ncbi:GNAT family N-acetyltransferase [Longimicrobium sp.]|jgi:ribosomal protein S18 acetylase RimI-like enzyme|uniref:GNAT family N-acetyltransferase n=1 Tax=Longimicrobium sp. TaxID=2029185 RepID=UPI002EDB5397
MQPSDAPAAIVRPATPADVPALGRLGALLVYVHHAFDAARFIVPPPDIEDAYAAFLGALLDDPDAVVLVAERDGSVVGYTYAAIEGTDFLALRGPAGVLHDLAVDPAHRAHGIGRMLVDATIAALRARGVRQAVLFTAVQNESAQRLFAHAGFRPTMIEMTRELDDEVR